VRKRVEVVRTDAEQPWHCRLVDPNNGEPVWWTETYADERDAVAAILWLPGFASSVRVMENGRLVELKGGSSELEVRYVDERKASS
jgi:hypothetical protein